jgi:PTH1 family peptidyl-tRNA hydrolase
MWLIVGLGNPGKEYEYTRHNIGFLTIDHLIDQTEAHSLSSSSFHGELFKSSNLIFLKPTTYMNNSGKSLQAVKQFYKIELDNIIVVHDDLDLPFGALRFKKGGGSGGHNGLKSIDEKIGRDYIRVRMGIGKPTYKSQVADYVLSQFSKDELENLPQWIEKSAKSVLELTKHPLNIVSSKYTIRDKS